MVHTTQCLVTVRGSLGCVETPENKNTNDSDGYDGMGDAWHFNSAIHTVRRWDGGGGFFFSIENLQLELMQEPTGTLALQVW